MHQISPSVNGLDIRCAELVAPPTGLVVFGASGDLAHRKLLPNLLNLYQRELLSENFYLLGCGRKTLSDQDFRASARKAIADALVEVRSEALEQFLQRVFFISGDYDDDSFYARMAGKLSELDEKYNTNSSHVFYLAIPPMLYGTVAEKLALESLSGKDSKKCRLLTRLVVEKPFGKDLDSARGLNEQLLKYFDESQIYRIDHYLGKETVQNILMFRFANAIFEPIWNRDYVDHVQITTAESLGVGHRAGYYDGSGALGDMFQNHMLGMLGFVAMEPPTSFEADHIRDEKVKLLRSIRQIGIDEPWTSTIVRGQYTSGTIEGEAVVGYTEESDVSCDSRTETFVAAKLFIDNWRWKDVPFYLRTGKRLAKKNTEIAITFKKVPHSMFFSQDPESMPPNVLVLKIQPDEGIELSFQAKRPGSKTCMSTLTMNFNYQEVFGVQAPEAYQRLLLDCMVGDQTLFTRQDDVEVSWKLVTPVLDLWARDKDKPFQYPAGAESFSEADALIESDGRSWRDL